MARRKLTVPRFTLVRDVTSAIWHVSYTDPATGYTRKRSTGARERSEAERVMPSVVSAIMTAKPLEGTTYKLGELLGAFERVKCRGGKNATYYALKPLCSYFHAFTPDQLNDAAWMVYREQRTRQKNGSAAFKARGEKLVSDATACKELNVMRAAISWARRNGWKGLENVAVHIEDQPDYAVQEYLTREEARRLVECCIEPHTRLFVRIALATGARMSAILELTWDRINWPVGKRAPVSDNKALYAADIVEGGPEDVDFSFEMKDGLRLDLGRGRGNKRRGTGVIALDNWQLYFDLKSAYDRRGGEYVVSYRGKKLGKVDLYDAYRRAGLVHYRRRTHLLKHTCCSWLVQAGVSYEAVAKLVGTRAETIRKHYGHLSPEHLEAAARVLSI